MRIENSVRLQQKPWFSDPELAEKILPSLAEDVRVHAQNLIRDGVTVIKGAFSSDVCRELITRFKKFAVLNPDKFSPFVDGDGHYPRIINLHTAFPDLFQLFSENHLAYRVQEAMFQAPPCLYTSLFYERGSAQPPHRDTPVFTTAPEHFYFGVWVALEDANAENGALQIYRGGHAIPELDREAMALRHFNSLDDLPSYSHDLWIEYQNTVAKQCEDAGIKPELLCVEAGDTVIWHPQLPHGGSPIRNLAKSRFSFVMHTTPIGVPVYHQNAFFNPRGNHSFDAGWHYKKIQDKYLVDHLTVDFDHKQAFDKNSFQQLPDQPSRGVDQVSAV